MSHAHVTEIRCDLVDDKGHSLVFTEESLKLLREFPVILFKQQQYTIVSSTHEKMQPKVFIHYCVFVEIEVCTTSCYSPVIEVC